MLTFILLTMTFIPVAHADEPVVLNVYYIEKRPNNSKWFVPYMPGDGEGNSTILYPGEFLNLSLEIRYFQGQMLPTEASLFATFNSYTTTGRTDAPEHFQVVSASTTGKYRDIPQTDYGALIKLSIKLEGGSPGDSVEIYCGQDGYHSKLTTPYDKAYIESDSNGGVNMLPCYTIAGVVIAVLALAVGILHIRDRKQRLKKEK
jgi:hypothetical protein